jgi:hypothetical protein
MDIKKNYVITYCRQKSNLNVGTCFETPNLAIPRSTVQLQKLTGAQLATKFPAFYQNRKFITILTRVRLSPTSYIRLIEATPPPPHLISSKSTFILSYYLQRGLPSGLFRTGLPTKTQLAFLFSFTRATYPTHSPLFDLIIPRRRPRSTTPIQNNNCNFGYFSSLLQANV